MTVYVQPHVRISVSRVAVYVYDCVRGRVRQRSLSRKLKAIYITTPGRLWSSRRWVTVTKYLLRLCARLYVSPESASVWTLQVSK